MTKTQQIRMMFGLEEDTGISARKTIEEMLLSHDLGSLSDLDQIEELFRRYKKTKDNDTFTLLYLLMEPHLYKALYSPIRIYSEKIQSQKFATIRKYENPEKGIFFDISKLLKNIRKDYIKQFGTFKGCMLMSDFEITINSLSVETAQAKTKQYSNSYEYLLMYKFCDQYWNFIKKCLRSDEFHYKHSPINNMPINPDFQSSEMELISLRNTIFPDPEETVIIKESMNEIMSNFDAFEANFALLLLQDYKISEISSILNVEPQILYRLRRKMAKKYSHLRNAS